MPGIYTHQHNARQIFDGREERVHWPRATRRRRASGLPAERASTKGKAPQDVGFAFAGVWQGVIDVARSVANVKLPVDINVSAWTSPSESGTRQLVQ